MNNNNTDLLVLEEQEKEEVIAFNGVNLTLGDIYNKYLITKDNAGNIHKATREEWERFKYLMIIYKLDPNINEISCLPFFSKKEGRYTFTPMVGVNGYTRHAMESGLINGWDDEVIFSKDGNVQAVKARVYIKGWDNPITETVYRVEYDPNLTGGNSPMWRKMPITMLRKVALVSGLRRAGILNGTYIKEEMEQIDTRLQIKEEGEGQGQGQKSLPKTQKGKSSEVNKSLYDQVESMALSLVNDHGVSKIDIKNYIIKEFKKDKLALLDNSELERFKEYLEGELYRIESGIEALINEIKTQVDNKNIAEEDLFDIIQDISEYKAHTLEDLSINDLKVVLTTIISL